MDDHSSPHERLDSREWQRQLARIGRDRQGLCDQSAPASHLVLVCAPCGTKDTEAGLSISDEATGTRSDPEQLLVTLRTLAVQIDGYVRRGTPPLDALEPLHG